VLSDLLDAFGRKHTGEPLKLDRHGVCQLDFRGGSRLAIEPEEGTSRAWIYADLARVPALDPGPLFGKLLAANLFGHLTDDAWFALDTERGEIVLNRTFDAGGLDPVQFDGMVTGFMDMVELWSRELAAHMAGADDPGLSDAAAPTSPGSVIRG
jgi:hypothetical protein